MLRLAGSAIERRKMMTDYEKVAKWITEECEDNHQEVACLLKMLYGEGKPELTFEETYQDVLDLMEWEESLGFILNCIEKGER